jgi:hypothetical protein
VVAVNALACELPAATGVPLARRHCPDLAREGAAQGMGASVSGSIWQWWLSADAVKPWRVGSWIFPRDPAFAVEAGRNLNHYARTWGRGSRQGRLRARSVWVIDNASRHRVRAAARSASPKLKLRCWPSGTTASGSPTRSSGSSLIRPRPPAQTPRRPGFVREFRDLAPIP